MPLKLTPAFCDLLIGGLDRRQNDFEMPGIARTILMHPSARLGMRLAALLIILKLASKWYLLSAELL